MFGDHRAWRAGGPCPGEERGGGRRPAGVADTEVPAGSGQGGTEVPSGPGAEAGPVGGDAADSIGHPDIGVAGHFDDPEPAAAQDQRLRWVPRRRWMHGGQDHVADPEQGVVAQVRGGEAVFRLGPGLPIPQ